MSNASRVSGATSDPGAPTRRCLSISLQIIRPTTCEIEREGAREFVEIMECQNKSEAQHRPCHDQLLNTHQPIQEKLRMKKTEIEAGSTKLLNSCQSSIHSY